MKVLCGDIGGTKTVLRLLASDRTGPQTLAEERYASADFAEFNDLLTTFLRTPQASDPQDIARACFAVAGPIETGTERQTARVTNLPWRIDSAELAQRFALDQVRLINDFAAIAYGLDGLRPDALLTLQPGAPAGGGTRLILGPGTGLGVALAYDGTDGIRVQASEGGHADFAPSTATEWELLRALQEQFEHVSWERVVSGPGLVALYRFFAGAGAAAVLAAPDPAAAITERAGAQNDPAAVTALRTFVRLLGRFAGNLALIALPDGGVYIGGGIAAKIADALRGEEFLHAFGAKGRMSELMARFPVRIILDPDAGLAGATQVALAGDD